ncbi:MAG: protein kinase domain-containing protein [Bryobacteraceae bacterium]
MLAPLGAGGMGEVYRARDPRLRRDVAIKIASAHFSNRFEIEARAVAALNHPNVCAIHDVGPDFLVMELVEGETLADRLRRGPLPVEEALAIAKQIAEGLEAAHERGIVHRDLKSANVKITPEGVVKILDFGLAKTAVQKIGENDSTVTSPATIAGTILGTAAYMSPEQAQGKAVDRRADIWAFGCVLFEMLAGKRAFDGETLTDTLAAVLRADIAWDALPKQTPPALIQLIRRCLERNIRQRLQAIGDARIAIGEIQSGSSREEAAVVSVLRRYWRWVPWIAVICLVVALAAVLLFRRVPQQPVAVSVPVRVSLPLPGDSNLFQPFAISPDGKTIVWSGATAQSPQPQLWMRTLASGSAAPILGSENCSFPFWSPDSRFVACFTDSALMRFDTTNGQAMSIADVTSASGGGTWGADGNTVIGSNQQLYEVSASGGSIRKIAAPDAKRGEMGYLNPFFLPGGHKILLYVVGTGQAASGVYVMDLRTKAKKFLVSADAGPWYARGYLFYARQGALEAQAFDPQSETLAGDPVTVARHVPYTLTHHAVLAVSASGLLGFKAPGFVETHLSWYSREGKDIGALGSRGEFWTLALSRDGAHAAVSVAGNIWLYGVARGTATQLTFKGNAFAPVWSADDTRVFYSMGNGIWSRAVNGLEPAEKVVAAHVPVVPTALSPDGKELAYLKNDSRGLKAIWLHSLEKPKQRDRRLLPANIDAGMAQFSPDGHWISFTTGGAGQQHEIYVVPYPNVSNRW